MYILLFYFIIDGLKKKMLKTYSKEAVKNIKNYVCDNVDFTGYDKYAYIEKFEEDTKHGRQIDMFSVYAYAIYDCFYDEKVKYDKRNMSIQDLFIEWCQGLPSVLDTCYYYNRSAVDDLAYIESEKVIRVYYDQLLVDSKQVSKELYTLVINIFEDNEWRF